MTRRLTLSSLSLAAAAALTLACGKDSTGPRIGSVTVSRDTATLVPNATAQLTATVKDVSGNGLSTDVAWASSDRSHVIVSGSGLITGVAVGSATISATAGGHSAVTQVTVKEGAVVGTNGGVVTALGGRVELTIPHGAVTSDVQITVQPVANPTPSSHLVPGTAIELGPTGQQFAAPVRLSIHYTSGQLAAGTVEQLLRINRDAGGTWQPVAGSTTDVANQVVSANLTGFSAYSVLTSPITGVFISPSNATLEQGVSFQAVATAHDTVNATVSDVVMEWHSSNPTIATVASDGVVTGVAPGGPVTITATANGRTATMTVTVTARPAIFLSAEKVDFNGLSAGADPASQLIDVTNSGGGTLDGLTVTSTESWLTATLAAPIAPTKLTLHASPAALVTGTYTATVTVSTTHQGVASHAMTVTFTVGQPGTQIGISATTASFTGATGGANPPAQTIDVTNAGNGALSGLSVTVAYASGEPTGWLSAKLSQTTAPATLTLTPNSAGLTSGAHAAAVTVSSKLADVASRTVSVTMTLVAPSIVINAGNNEAAMAGTPVPTAPSVLVRDGLGQPMAGLAVTFAVTGGDGSLTSPITTTDATGIARVGSWVLGLVANPNAMSASVSGPGFSSGNNSVTFSATGCEGGGSATSYAITLCFVTSMSASQRSAFEDAAARWSSLITGDLSDIPAAIQQGACGPNSPSLNMTIDDLLIFARIEPIDGVNGVLGSAGPCFIRTSNHLSLIGQMRFDSADMPSLETNNLLRSVILHEMGHVLGIGSLWQIFSLLKNPSTVGGPALDTYFSGTNAIDAFNAIGGTTYTLGQKVPVENMFGSGTINSHWRESVLANELMTGFIGNGLNPLSAVTVQSLADLGYSVNASGADPFQLTLSLQALGVRGSQRAYGNDVIVAPLMTIDARGRIVRIR